MANKTRIIRSVESTPQNYTPLSNKLLQNKHLSLDTRGLLCYLISLPSTWVVYKHNIRQELGFGRKKNSPGINNKDSYRDVVPIVSGDEEVSVSFLSIIISAPTSVGL